MQASNASMLAHMQSLEAEVQRLRSEASAVISGADDRHQKVQRAHSQLAAACHIQRRYAGYRQRVATRSVVEAFVQQKSSLEQDVARSGGRVQRAEGALENMMQQANHATSDTEALMG